jgi:hypothetical protein
MFQEGFFHPLLFIFHIATLKKRMVSNTTKHKPGSGGSGLCGSDKRPPAAASCLLPPPPPPPPPGDILRTCAVPNLCLPIKRHSVTKCDSIDEKRPSSNASSISPSTGNRVAAADRTSFVVFIFLESHYIIEIREHFVNCARYPIYSLFLFVPYRKKARARRRRRRRRSAIFFFLSITRWYRETKQVKYSGSQFTVSQVQEKQAFFLRKKKLSR